MKTQEKWGLGILVGSLVTWAFWKSASASSGVMLSEKDSGSTITVKPGMTIVVTLPTNPSTGYGWYAATERFPLGRPEVGPSAGAETRTYRITPAMIGSHRVQLEYKRIGEQNTEPAGVFFFDAVVNP